MPADSALRRQSTVSHVKLCGVSWSRTWGVTARNGGWERCGEIKKGFVYRLIRNSGGWTWTKCLKNPTMHWFSPTWMNLWEENFRKQYSWSTTTLDLPFARGSEPITIHTNASLKMKLVRESGFPKSFNARDQMDCRCPSSGTVAKFNTGVNETLVISLSHRTDLYDVMWIGVCTELHEEW